MTDSNVRPSHIRPIKVLVTGGEGQLGREIELIAQKSDQRQLSFTFTDRDTLDITDKESVANFPDLANYDFIINCAAYTNVDKAQEDVEVCRLINSEGVRNLATACTGSKTRLIQISTDYVFDGTSSTPYKESDKTNPASVYGQTKAEAEKIALSLKPDTIIVRTGWLYSSHHHNFVKTIIAKAREGQHLFVVDDQHGTPTWAANLAEVLVNIVTSSNPLQGGIYHYANKGITTWHGFAQKILEDADLDTPLSPCTTEQSARPAPRPAYSVMECTKIEKALDIQIPEWKHSLKQCIKQLTQS